jgi:hypothetical protein
MSLKKHLIHILKLIAIVIPIALLFNIGLLVINIKPNPIVNFILGIVLSFAANYYLSDDKGREAIKRHLVGVFSDHWANLCHALCGLTAMLYFSDTAPKPSNDHVLALVGFVNVACPLLLLCIVGGVFWSGLNSWNFITKTVNFLVSWSFALWVIGQIGDAAYAEVVAHPSGAILQVVAFFIIITIYRIAQIVPHPQTNQTQYAYGYAGSGISLTARISKPTESDNRFIAAHEAGHALFYAALDNLPDDFEVVAKDHSDSTANLGFVSGIKNDNLLLDKTFVEWQMLVFLAGKQSELVLLGNTSMGSSNDHEKWLNHARLYLYNGTKGIFYGEPSSKHEIESNEGKLELLRDEQIETIQHFLRINAEVLKELYDELFAKRRLVKDDLSPFLARVVIPDYFPSPVFADDK